MLAKQYVWPLGLLFCALSSHQRCSLSKTEIEGYHFIYRTDSKKTDSFQISGDTKDGQSLPWIWILEKEEWSRLYAVVVAWSNHFWSHRWAEISYLYFYSWDKIHTTIIIIRQSIGYSVVSTCQLRRQPWQALFNLSL